jgi:hypothetical protein
MASLGSNSFDNTNSEERYQEVADLPSKIINDLPQSSSIHNDEDL